MRIAWFNLTRSKLRLVCDHLIAERMMEEVLKREGCAYVCECPEAVKKLEVRRGKVVATLESGMKFIVPIGEATALRTDR
jgi:hypothetical protein